MPSPFLWKVLGLAVFLAASSPVSAEPIKWGGCSFVEAAVLDPLVDPYRVKTGVPVQIQDGGPGYGFRGVASGELDLGGACRPAGPEDPAGEVELVQVAWEALVPIVNPSNPVEQVTLAQLRGIFRGEITNWAEVEGPDRFIVVGHRAHGASGPGRAFRRLAFESPLAVEDLAPGLSRKATRALEAAVADLDNAIAVTGLSNARKREVKILPLDAANPTPESVAAGRYPLRIPLFLVVPKDPAPEVQRFVDFVLSDEGQRILKRNGRVNLRMGESLENPWNGVAPAAGGSSSASSE